MLDRLVGRAILAEGDGIVGPHVQVRDLHEGGQTHCRTLVIGELEEGAVERTGVGAQQDAVRDGAHGELAHAEVQLAAVLGLLRPRAGLVGGRAEGLGAVDVGVVGATEIGGTAPQLRHNLSDGVEDLSGGLTGCDALADFLSGLELVDGLVEAFRQLVRLDALVQGGLVRVGLLPGGELLVPFLVGFETALGDLTGMGEGFLVDREVDIRVEAEFLLQAGNGFGAELGAVGRLVVGLARGRPCDERIDLDEVRTVGDSFRLVDGSGERFDVLLVGAVRLDEGHFVGVPAIGFVTLEDVLGEGELGVAFDLDVVRIEDHEEVAELLVARERAGLGGNALFDIAFAADDPHLVVERGGAFSGIRVEQAALEALAIGEADRGGETLAERAGGHFDARGQAVFRMARGAGVGAATEVLEVVQRQAIAGEEQLHVLRERSMATGEDEAITSGPLGIVRIVLDVVLIQRVGNRSQGHWGAGVAVSSTLDGVGGEDLRHLDGALVQFRPGEIGHR